MNIKHKGALALAFVIFELSFWSIFLKIGGTSIGLIPQLFYGFLVGFIVSLSISLIRDKGSGLRSVVKNPNMLVLIIIMGLLNNAFTQLFLGVGTLGTNPSIGAIVYRSWPIIIALLTPLVVKQRVRKLQTLATVLGFVGIYVILNGGVLFNFNLATTLFIGALLVAALCTSFSGLFMNRYTFDAFGAVVMFNLSSLIFVAVLAFITHTSLNVTFTVGSAISVLFLGAFAYGIGTALVYYVIKVFGPLLFGNVALSIPFFTIVLSAFLTGTQIKAYYIVAALLISSGIMLQRYGSVIPERITKRGSLSRITLFDVTGAFVSNRSQLITKQVRGGGRALAIKLDDETIYHDDLHRWIFEKRNCIVFTNIEPLKDSKPEEIAFINDIMGMQKGGTALIAMGEPESIEDAFEEFASVSKKV